MDTVQKLIKYSDDVTILRQSIETSAKLRQYMDTVAKMECTIDAVSKQRTFME